MESGAIGSPSTHLEPIAARGDDISTSVRGISYCGFYLKFKRDAKHCAHVS